MTTNENAAPGWLPGSGVESNCACHFSPAIAQPSIGPAPAGRQHFTVSRAVEYFTARELAWIAGGCPC